MEIFLYVRRIVTPHNLMINEEKNTWHKYVINFQVHFALLCSFFGCEDMYF